MALFIEGLRSEVRVHLASGRRWIGCAVSVCVKLREELLDRSHAACKDPCLIAIVAGAKIPVPKSFCERDLCHLLPITEDAELGLARKYFLPPDEACFAAHAAEPIVGQHLLPELLEAQFL